MHLDITLVASDSPKINQHGGFLVLGFVFFLCSLSINAQDTLTQYASRVSTLDHTISTLYEVISGDAGVQRDWELFKYLFAEHAQLIPTQDAEMGRKLVHLSPDDYVKRSGAWLEENGFFEKEIHRVVETFGSITHVFSTYESYRSSNDENPFSRGINSIQLFNDGKRWWIVNIYWQNESDQHPLPAKYLP